MNYRKSFWLLIAAFVVGVALMYLYMAVDHIFVAYLGMACIIAGFVQMVKYYRCPHCGKLLHLKGGIPKVCPECGKELK